MKGAAHYITPRLCEFEEMAFVMHFLRPGELFVDVGANVGAFTVLAAGVAGAAVRAFEPNPGTFEMLERNVRLNGLQEAGKLCLRGGRAKRRNSTTDHRPWDGKPHQRPVRRPKIQQP